MIEVKLFLLDHEVAEVLENVEDLQHLQTFISLKKEILKNFPLSTILRPSVVYSVDDNFTTNFMTLLSLLPIFPIYQNVF